MMCAFLVPARAVALFDRAPFLRRVLLFAAELLPPFWSACQMRFRPSCGGEALHGLTPGRLFQSRTSVARPRLRQVAKLVEATEVIACLWLWLPVAVAT